MPRFPMFAQASLRLLLRLFMQRRENKVVTKWIKPVPTTVDEMHQIVRAAAEPWRAGDSVKAGINRAARTLGLSPRRAQTFWYARPAQVLADEADRLRAWKLAHIAREIERSEQRTCELRAQQGALRAKIHDTGMAMAEHDSSRLG